MATSQAADPWGLAGLGVWWSLSGKTQPFRGVSETQANIPSSILNWRNHYPHPEAGLLPCVLLQMLGRGTLQGKQTPCPDLAWMYRLMWDQENLSLSLFILSGAVLAQEG